MAVIWMARFMTLDIFAPYLGMAAVLGAACLLFRLSWRRLFLFVIVILGGLLSAFAASITGWFALEASGLPDSSRVPVSAAAGFTAWAFLCFRLFLRHRSSSTDR